MDIYSNILFYDRTTVDVYKNFNRDINRKFEVLNICIRGENSTG